MIVTVVREVVRERLVMKSRKFSQCKYVSPRKINPSLTISTEKYRYLDNSRMKRTMKLFPSSLSFDRDPF